MSNYRPLRFPPHITDKLKRSGSKICITGASGWVGKALLEMCESCFGDEFDDRVAAFASKPSTLQLRSGKLVELHALQDLPAQAAAPWLLCHLAFLTKDKIAAMGFADFIAGNKTIREHVDKALHQCPPAAMLYASSGAVYDARRQLIRDMEVSPYGALKTLDEEHFAAVAQANGFAITIPRIFNISGPYINKWQIYALSNLIMQGYQQGRMTINASHPVIRSYMHVEDIVSAAFVGLFDSSAAVCQFDTASDHGIELQELAQRINNTLFEGKLLIERSRFDPTLPADRYVGQCDIPLRIPLREQIQETADYLKAYADATS